MSDAATTALLLEMTAQLEELRSQLPQKPAMEITRDDFFKLSPTDQRAALARGACIFDGPPPPRPRPAPGSVTRQEFDSWGADKRHGHIKAGRAVHD